MVARYSQGHPPSGCPQLLAVPPSPGAARRQTPPLQRSDPGHGHFSPSAQGTATHPALPHIGAPQGDARSCSGHPQTAENSGFVCKVQSQGLAALGINSGY